MKTVKVKAGPDDNQLKLNPKFILNLALSNAPMQFKSEFQSAFSLFTEVLLRQRQLSAIEFIHEDGLLENGGKESLLHSVDEACSIYELNRYDIDPDRIIWTREKVLRKYLIKPGQWITLYKYQHQQEDLGSPSSKLSRKEPGFTCQILPIPLESIQSSSSSAQNPTTGISFNSVTEYNLRRVLGIPQFAPLPCFQIRPLLTDLVFRPPNKRAWFSPILGKSMKITRLKSRHEISLKECDMLLHDLFSQNCKFLCVGDIISIPLQNHSSRCLELIVSEINGKGTNDESYTEVFKITQEFTRVALNSNELSNHFHTKCDSQQINKLLAPCLKQHFDKLCLWLTTALRSLHMGKTRKETWPSFLIYGPVGTGKYSVCYAASAYFGLNFYFVNAANLIGDTSAYTEGKLRAIYEKIKNSLSPTLLFIKNVHLLGKDKDGQEDKRVLLAVKEFLNDISIVSISKTSYSAKNVMVTNVNFVIGSTDIPEALAPPISQTFLFRLQLPTIISESDTIATLQWLIEKGKAKIHETFDLPLWIRTNWDGVQRTYGDLKAAAAIAMRNACIRNAQLEHNDNNGHFRITETDLAFGLKTVNTTINKATSAVEIPNVNWEDIGGLEDIKIELISSVKLPLEFPHLFTSGVRRSGILLYGPPGTGKTLIAKAVATEFKLSFLSVKGPELLNMYVGQSEQNVRDVFTKAREAAPCIIFFDELDALAPNRGRAGDSGGVMDRVVSQILAELDGTHSTTNIFIIGATNRPDLIDPALLRPGRFDKLLYVGINRDVDSKTSVLKALTRKFQLADDVSLRQVAEKLPNGMSGADLYSLCSDAYMTAVERQITTGVPLDVMGQNETEAKSFVIVKECDFESAISRAFVSLPEMEQARYEALTSMKR